MVFWRLFPYTPKHVIRKDVRFTLKGSESNNRNHSLSICIAMVDFKNTIDHFHGDYHLSMDH